jgi:anti-anti-sigma factor
MPPAIDATRMPLVEIIVTEPFGAEAASRVAPVLDDAIALRPAELVVDLTTCEYLDAAGIGLLLDVHRRVWQTGGRLRLRGLSPRLHRILHLARVDRVLDTAAVNGNGLAQDRSVDRRALPTATGNDGRARRPNGGTNR